jgi:predicted ribosome quality control (RQC) complex YloA/Tae2 family protein
MEIELDFTKSAQENANDYFNKSKKLALKKEGASKAIKDLEKRLIHIQKNKEVKPEKRIIAVKKKEWYENFHWFFTTSGLLAIGGRDAHQNELVNSKHFDDKDIFFHSDIFGAPVFILKGGVSATREVKQEVAEFAACYSSAWKAGLRTIDVYAMRRDQISKSSSKGSLGTGSFLMSGERDWYRSVPLSLFMLVKDDKLCALPKTTFDGMGFKGTFVRVTQGNFKKSEAAKKVAAKLSYSDLDTIMRQLPTGSFRIE